MNGGIRRYLGHTIYPPGLRSGGRCLDLGANHGEFSRGMEEQHGLYCVMVEPNPELARSLSRNGGRVISAAVGTTSGHAVIEIATNDQASRVVLDGNMSDAKLRVPLLTVEQIVDEVGWIDGTIDLVKIDIEGHEADVLMGLDDALLGRIGQITVEFHDFCGWVTPEAVELVHRRLASLGFAAIRGSRQHNDDVLFLNARLLGVGAASVAINRHVVRNVLGVVRLGRRLLGGGG